jgi:hypothetical protein
MIYANLEKKLQKIRWIIVQRIWASRLIKCRMVSVYTTGAASMCAAG